LFINGQLIGGCELGELSNIRCLHRPYLFKPPPSVWRVGSNQIEFEIFADDRQMNGLSAPVVGDAERLDRGVYASDYFWRVETIHMLTWASLTLGVLALAVGLLLRAESSYLWFGLASITNALSNLNTLVSQPAVPPELFSWFAFSSRMVSAPFLLMTFASFFGPTPAWLRRSVLAYVLVGPLAVALSANDRWVALALYVPILAMALGYAYWIVRDTIRSHDSGKTLVAFAYVMLLVIGAIDFARLGGATRFEGVYLIGYAHSGVMVIFGIALVALLANALKVQRTFNVRLEREVADRTSDLESAYRDLTDARVERSRVEERERLLQDMHDGFGSQLVSARLMVEQGQIGPAQLAQLLQECIADLYLVADTLSGHDDSIADAMVDLRARSERRLAGSAVELRWLIALDGVPRMPPRVILQVLRIVQEALNNALKHALARTIRVDASWNTVEKMITISVVDDGIGLADSVRRGRGLNNMQRRAREVGGDLSIIRGPVGTQVCLRLKEEVWLGDYPDPSR
jgi:signal transduction histidine kinase